MDKTYFSGVDQGIYKGGFKRGGNSSVGHANFLLNHTHLFTKIKRYHLAAHAKLRTCLSVFSTVSSLSSLV